MQTKIWKKGFEALGYGGWSTTGLRKQEGGSDFLTFSFLASLFYMIGSFL
jgi:hypothetical protein